MRTRVAVVGMTPPVSVSGGSRRTQRDDVAGGRGRLIELQRIAVGEGDPAARDS